MKEVSFCKVSILDYIKYFFLIFLYIFGPVLNKYGPFFDLVFFVSILIVVRNFQSFKSLDRPMLNFFYLLVVLYVFVSFRILWYPKLSISIWLSTFLKPFRILFTLWAGFFLAKSLFEKKFTFRDLLLLVFTSILFHAIIMAFQFVDKEFRDFIYSYTTIGEFRSTFEYDFRMGGLSGGSGGATLSVVQSLGIIIVPFLFKTNINFQNKIFITIGFFIILFSIIICGRSGIYNVILFIPLIFFLIYKFFKAFKYLTFLIVFFVFLYIFIWGFIVSGDQTDLYYSFSRTFDSFIQLQETGKYENNTVLVISHYFLMPDLITFFIGDNDSLLNIDIDRNLDSDIGYVRNLFSFGIFGLIVYLFPFLYLIRFSIQNFHKRLENKFLFVLLIIMLIFHFKESFLYVRMFWSIISLFFGFLVFQKDNKIITS